jgi:hypothetical protein
MVRKTFSHVTYDTETVRQYLYVAVQDQTMLIVHVKQD